ncbi:MAG: CoA-binding protein [Anaerolineales bacterium]
MDVNSHDPEVMLRILNDTRTIAVVGFSTHAYRAGYYVPAYLQQQGYEIIPINPNLDQALGKTAFANLEEIPGSVDLVLIFRRSEAVPPIVEQAIQIGAKAVWMQRGIVNEAAARQATQAGLDVVMDACMMVEHRHYC